MTPVKTISLDPEKFCYWLQGFCEVSGEVPDEKQWSVIKDHLELVFTKAVPLTHYDPPINTGPLSGWTNTWVPPVAIC